MVKSKILGGMKLKLLNFLKKMFNGKNKENETIVKPVLLHESIEFASIPTDIKGEYTVMDIGNVFIINKNNYIIGDATVSFNGFRVNDNIVSVSLYDLELNNEIVDGDTLKAHFNIYNKDNKLEQEMVVSLKNIKLINEYIVNCEITDADLKIILK